MGKRVTGDFSKKSRAVVKNTFNIIFGVRIVRSLNIRSSENKCICLVWGVLGARRVNNNIYYLDFLKIWSVKDI